MVYRTGGGAIFNTKTSGNTGVRLVMQTDANLVLYSSTNQALWYNHANSVNGSTASPVVLKMQTDGNLVEYSAAGSALWSSKYGLAN